MHSSATTSKSTMVFWLLHGDLLNGLDVSDPVTESIDDLDVLNVGNSIPGIAKMFHIISEPFIMPLLDGFKSFSGR
jgi:hypothetical protein